MTSCSMCLEINVCIRAKWPIRSELIPVPAAWNNYILEYFYSTLDRMLVHRRVTTSIKFDVHLGGERHPESVLPKNTTQCPPWPGLEPRPLAPETSALAMRSPRHPRRVFRIKSKTSETISHSAECYAGLSVRVESSDACI